MTLATLYSIALQHVILPPLAVSELAESSPRLSCLLSNITSKWNINRCRWKWDNFINKVVNISSVAAWEAHQKPKSLLDHQCLLPQFFKLSHVKSMFRFPPWTRQSLIQIQSSRCSTHINDFTYIIGYIMSVYTCIVQEERSQQK